MILTPRQKRGFGLFLTLVALYLFADWFEHRFLDEKRYRKRIVRTLELLTGLPVRVGEIRVRPLSGFTVGVKQLEILSPDPRDPPFLSVEKAEFRLGDSLFADRQEPWKLTSLHLERPHLNWIRHTPYPFLQTKKGKGQLKLLFPRGEFSMQKGIATFMDRASQIGTTWILDQVNLSTRFQGIQGVTPLSLSAKLQGLPLTLTGTVGPFPKDNDLLALPMLFNLSAKTDDPSSFLEQLLPGGAPFKMARGNLSLLLQGTIRDDLQSSLRLELLKLEPRAAHPESPAMDLTLRNKSHLSAREGRVTLTIDEGFLDVDGKPTLSLEGGGALGQDPDLDLTMTSLAPMPLSSLPGLWDRVGGKAQGMVHLRMSGQSPTTLQTRLNLTASRLDLPWNINKKAGEPLFLDADLMWEQGKILMEEATLTLSPGEKVQCKGEVSPDTRITLSGQLLAESLPRYMRLPWATWPLHGNLDMELTLANREGAPELAGRLGAEQILLGPLDWRQARTEITASKDRLTLSHFSASLWDGLMEGDLFLIPKEGGFGRVGFTLAGVSTDKLLSALFPKSDSPLWARGPLSAQGSLEGFPGADDPSLQWPMGRVSAWIPGGHLTGVDLPALSRKPEAPLPLTREKGMDFTHISLDMQVAGKGVLLEKLRLNHPLVMLQGQGKKRPEGPLELTLESTPVWPTGSAVSLLLQGEGKNIRLLSTMAR